MTWIVGCACDPSGAECAAAEMVNRTLEPSHGPARQVFDEAPDKAALALALAAEVVAVENDAYDKMQRVTELIAEHQLGLEEAIERLRTGRDDDE